MHAENKHINNLKVIENHKTLDEGNVMMMVRID